MITYWTFDPNWYHEEVRSWSRKYMGEIAILIEGVELVTLRIPLAGGMPTFVGGTPATWIDLIGRPAQRKSPTMPARRNQRNRKSWNSSVENSIGKKSEVGRL